MLAGIDCHDKFAWDRHYHYQCDTNLHNGGGGISLWLTVMSLLLRLGKTNEIQDVAFKKDISYLEENNQQITSTNLCELIYIYLFEGGK